MLDMLLILSPMLIFMFCCWLYYKVIFMKYVNNFEQKYGVRPADWPLWLMLGTLIIVFAIPYFLHSFFDPIDLFDKGEFKDNSSIMFAKMLLAMLPAILFTFFYLLKKSKTISATLIATLLTTLAAFTAMFFYLMKAMLYIVTWLAAAIFGAGLSQGISSGGKKYRCSNCYAEVSNGATKCAGCGAELN